MSDTQDTSVTVAIADANGCHATTDDYLRGVDHVRVTYTPARTYTSPDGSYQTPLPAAARLRIGETTLTLSPAVWRAVINAVQRVLPVDADA